MIYHICPAYLPINLPNHISPHWLSNSQPICNPPCNVLRAEPSEKFSKGSKTAFSNLLWRLKFEGLFWKIIGHFFKKKALLENKKALLENKRAILEKKNKILENKKTILRIKGYSTPLPPLAWIFLDVSSQNKFFRGTFFPLVRYPDL